MLVTLATVLVVCALFTLFNLKNKESALNDDSYKQFQYLYLSVYLCMTMSDWLQVAYVYVLYESYGYNIDIISKLFILGFLSSMLFGTVVGSLSDSLGRKNICLVFTVLYIISCLTMHSSNLIILVIGRVIGGIATSILHSSFESWMIFEHNRSFDKSLIADTFHKQIFGNGLAAIVAGFLSHFLFDLYGKSPVIPFDAAIVFLVIGGIVILLRWDENYGDKTRSLSQVFMNGLVVMKKDARVLCVAISQSFFEASMYIFVFMWTPTLKRANQEGSELQLGFIFSSFMISEMIGSLIFKSTLYYEWITSNHVLLVVYVVAFISLAIPIFSSSFELILFGFLLFETCVGIFWPAISTVKSAIIPEEARATVMNYIRIPTNMIVVLSLYFVEQVPQFHVCCVLLIISFISQVIIQFSTINNENFS